MDFCLCAPGVPASIHEFKASIGSRGRGKVSPAMPHDILHNRESNLGDAVRPLLDQAARGHFAVTQCYLTGFKPVGNGLKGAKEWRLISVPLFVEDRVVLLRPENLLQRPVAQPV